MRVGLIGLGTIARGVLDQLRPEDDIQIVGGVVAHPTTPRPGIGVAVCGSLRELLEAGPEVVVELGGHAALREHGPAVLRAGTELNMLSVGALADPALEQSIVEAARAGGTRAVVLSGGIGALDAIAAARVGGLESVTHTVRKPAATLLGATEAHGMTEARELFCGTAREGVLLFPESINVAAAVSLAGLGLDGTQVRVIADPAVKRNRHEVVCEGAFGRLRFEIENVPSEGNPKTGRLVAMSVLHALRKRKAPIAIG
jgi:aspartate dehydrogenase